MFASGIAFFISRLDKSDQRNVIDWVIFFGSYQNYTNLEDVCDAYCIVCIFIWLIMFASGCFVQYKCHRKHKRKDNDDYDTDSDDSDYDESNKKKKRKRRNSDNGSSEEDEEREIKKHKTHYDEPARSVYGGYAGSEYAGSVRQHNRYGMSVYSASGMQEGNGRAPPAVAMSAPGGYNPHYDPNMAPGVAQSAQYGSYGAQRTSIQYV